MVHNPQAYRWYLLKYFELYPCAFPSGFEHGFEWHSTYKSKKQKGLHIRRLKLKDGRVYRVVPSAVMPYLSGKTDEVEKGLLLRHWAVPYEVIAYLFGRNAMYWERMEEGLGRMSLVGSVVKKSQIPTHLAADEKITFFAGQEAYIALTAGQECVLGAAFSLGEDTASLQAAYGVFKDEALDCQSTYQPESVNLDGWKATNLAWKTLFENITIVLCFLHAFLKVRELGKTLKERFSEVSQQIWDLYRAPSPEVFREACSKLNQWAEEKLTDYQKFQIKVKDLCSKVDRFIIAYNLPDCYRTSNQIDRPMNHLDRYLYQIRYFHGHRRTANLKIRAWAMIYNFMPMGYKVQKRKDMPKKQSRFEELNGFAFHQNWLHNLLIASSMNGFKQPPPNPLE